ncbi:phospholipase A2 inhibitor gamma subunit B-like [Ranitomeya variabilis]|uniref:phospholipase A2 inhibitor gamma subunit B-like n=1 Tax=Ranitomeya variabilis TaxID=490064 RepID=UPI0040561139
MPVTGNRMSWASSSWRCRGGSAETPEAKAGAVLWSRDPGVERRLQEPRKKALRLRIVVHPLYVFLHLDMFRQQRRVSFWLFVCIYIHRNQHGRISRIRRHFGPKFGQGCEPSFTCNSQNSMSSLYAQTRMVTSCCDTDDCAPDIPSLPTKLSQPNGLVCRSCQHTDPWCLTSETISCRGNENMCAHQTAQLKGPILASVTLWWCASESFCHVDPQVYKSEGIQAEINITCRNEAYQCT